MNLEEALNAMRSGSKIRHSGMPDDEYYMACKIALKGEPILIEKMPISIVWMKGDRQHSDMMPNWDPYDPKTDPCKHGMSPMINLLWLMSDGWEIVGDIL